MATLNSEHENRAVWQAIVEIADALGVTGDGVDAVRGLHAATVEGKRDESYWEQFRRPKEYANGRPAPVFDANDTYRTQAQRDEIARQAAERRKAWDALTGGGRR